MSRTSKRHSTGFYDSTLNFIQEASRRNPDPYPRPGPRSAVRTLPGVHGGMDPVRLSGFDDADTYRTHPADGRVRKSLGSGVQELCLLVLRPSHSCDRGPGTWSSEDRWRSSRTGEGDVSNRGGNRLVLRNRFTLSSYTVFLVPNPQVRSGQHPWSTRRKGSRHGTVTTETGVWTGSGRVTMVNQGIYGGEFSSAGVGGRISPDVE